MRAAMESVDYAFPGLEDAAVLTGLTDPDAILDYYLALCPQAAVLKMGEAGAYLAMPDRRVRIPGFPVQAVGATGAGDTFCGAFLARTLAGDSPESAARYACVPPRSGARATGRWPQSPRQPCCGRRCGRARIVKIVSPVLDTRS